MKNSSLLLSILAISFSGSSLAKSEEFPYIAVPEPDQVADLLDDDRDGVINARDKCTDTIRGAHVDNDGCGSHIKTSSQLQLKILFANDSAEINPVFTNEITKMVDFLQRYPQTSVELQGYASKTGDAAHNMALSKQRAEQVKQHIVDEGVDSSRVTIVGYGDTSLEDSGESEQSHAMNRRVTATVVGYNDHILDEWTIFSKRKK
ncbi:OmpA family protein [Vibrio sp. 99-8-1]|uniref:OmpA family protein n=2 Tax=unclassified Vibrio TaxID=2614977 RepID=UPI00149367AD|nr:OmpA family protein [Vibrio sp. 99-8-1]NOI68729.1 OmpA family protein [Vibrio sp. 99-8-1]